MFPLILWSIDDSLPRRRVNPFDSLPRRRVNPFDSLLSPHGQLQNRMREFQRDVDTLMGREDSLQLRCCNCCCERKLDEGLKMSEGENGRKMLVEMDLRQFEPKDVNLSVKDKFLVVEAKREEDDGEGGKSFRHYYRQYALPNDVLMDSFKSIMIDEGLLRIEADLLALEAPKPKEIEIPIHGEVTQKKEK